MRLPRPGIQRRVRRSLEIPGQPGERGPGDASSSSVNSAKSLSAIGLDVAPRAEQTASDVDSSLVADRLSPRTASSDSAACARLRSLVARAAPVRRLKNTSNRSIEVGEVFVALDQQRAAARLHVVADAEVDVLQRFGGVDQPARIDVQAGRPQQPTERDQVVEDGTTRHARAISSARTPPRSASMSSLALSSTPMVFLRGLDIERFAIERRERGRPVERFGHAGHLVQLAAAAAAGRRWSPARRAARRVRHALVDDGEFLLEGRVVDPLIQAAPFQRIVHLARPV